MAIQRVRTRAEIIEDIIRPHTIEYWEELKGKLVEFDRHLCGDITHKKAIVYDPSTWEDDDFVCSIIMRVSGLEFEDVSVIDVLNLKVLPNDELLTWRIENGC